MEQNNDATTMLLLKEFQLLTQLSQLKQCYSLENSNY